jgi:hypothetical protein
MENETRLWSEGSVGSGGGLAGMAFSAFRVLRSVFAFDCGPTLLDGTWANGIWDDDSWFSALSDAGF